MVTHISSPGASSLSSSPRSPQLSRAGADLHSLQAGPASHSRRASFSSQSQDRSRGRSRALSISTASNSSQSTLIPLSPTAHSLAGYPTAPRSQAGSSVAPSSYRAPSAATASSAHQSRHSHRSGSHSRSRRSRDVEEPVPNSFPWFGQTGDVEIRLWDNKRTKEKRYLLHGLILAQNSKWFDNDNIRRTNDVSTSSTGSSPSSYSGSQGWRADRYNPNERVAFELNWAQFVDDHQRLPVLRRCEPSRAWSPSSGPPPPVSIHNKPTLPTTSFFRNIASGMNSNHIPAEVSLGRSTTNNDDDEDMFRAYDSLFLIFYNHSPKLSTTNIATAYVDAKLLLSLAGFYSAIDTVGPRIDHHLLRFGSRLWKQIAKYPPSYLKLGYTAKSRAIFAEALTHVVGTWPMASTQLKRGTRGIDDNMLNLIEDKIDEVEDTKLKCEAKLFRTTLTTGRGERVNPANSYTDWLALSLFRQWVADNTAPAHTGILKDSPTSPRSSNNNDWRSQSQTPPRIARTYRTLAAGGQAYLSHDECKRFLKLQPAEYSRENLRRFERRMEELKNLARDAVRPLTRHCLELDMSQGLDYLTCVRCEERDFSYIWGS